MRNKIANKEKIVIGIVVLFMITPILASLSYAEFVEHLWSLEAPQVVWYDSNFHLQFDSEDHVSPFENSAQDPVFHITETQNPYVLIIMTGLLAISVYLVFRNEKISKDMRT